MIGEERIGVVAADLWDQIRADAGPEAQLEAVVVCVQYDDGEARSVIQHETDVSEPHALGVLEACTANIRSEFRVEVDE